MSYRVDIEQAVLRQLNRFPPEALDALISVLADVTLYPGDPLRTRPGGGPYERWAVFGAVGMVTYEVDDGRQVITLTDITWAG